VHEVDWSKLPDLGAVALLAGAFASVARQGHTPVSKLWLTGWVMIELHFAAFLFLNAPGAWGTLAESIGLLTLIWSGFLFMWASVPYRDERSSPWMFFSLIGTSTLYLGVLIAAPSPAWVLTLAAALIGIAPLTLTLLTARKFNHRLRWSVTALSCVLSVFLLLVQQRPGDGANLALDALLFTVFFNCCIHFFNAYFRATAGAFITIAGFLFWSLVFVVGPLMAAFWPNVHVENEVWNLPKFVVAVGMILLLLEDQIEHNKYLALHDELTGLPNRRLFQDRLDSALERARRTGAEAALLLIDLDHFKQVNDTMGHHVGDLLLQHAASIFAGRIRRSDTVARTGGDEFCVILGEPISRADATLVADTLMQILKNPIQLEGHEIQVGASVGIAVFPQDATDAESLCIAADLRMYENKLRPGRPERLMATEIPAKCLPPAGTQMQAGLPFAK
jgi:diguanylate cyclase (GGDEF)-like protein